MKTTKQLLVVVATITMVATLNVARATTIDGSTTAGWTTDRYPGNLTSTTVNGRQALQLTTTASDSLNNRTAPYNSTFYNTQGSKQSLTTSSGAWSYNADLNVTAGMLNGTVGPRSSELWLGSGVNSGYYAMGLLSGVNSRSYGATATSGSMIGIFNDLTANWTYLSTASLLVGWNTFGVTSDGINTINYFINGVNVLTQTGMGGPTGDPSIDKLSTVYLQNYNYFGGTESPVTSYESSWSATPESSGSVPDTASTFGLLGISIGGLALAGRRKFASQS